MKFMNQYKDITDSFGFLKDYRKWSHELAYALAEEEGIVLTNGHWEVIDFLRNYYSIYKESPAIRLLVKSLKEKCSRNNHFNSLYLQTLFPISPAVQAARISGLPKPKTCI